MAMRLRAAIAALLLSNLLTIGAVNKAYGSDSSSCPTVDLRQEFDFGIVRSQKNLGWCFAYAAADVIGFALKKQVSPFDIAINSFREKFENGPESIRDFRGGNLRRSLRGVALRGVCDARKVSAASPLAVRSLLRIEEFAAEIAAEKRNRTLTDLEVRRRVSANAFFLRIVFPTSTLEELISAFRNIRDVKYPITSVINQICGARTSVASLDYRIRGRLDRSDNLAIFKRLLRERRPVIVGYSSQTLLDLNFANAEGDHASTIVGMRFRNNKCEYLLRNSWGNSGQRKYDRALIQGYASGYVWIPENIMEQMVARFSWIALKTPEN